jgi:hypothetical protein
MRVAQLQVWSIGWVGVEACLCLYLTDLQHFSIQSEREFTLSNVPSNVETAKQSSIIMALSSENAEAFSFSLMSAQAEKSR